MAMKICFAACLHEMHANHERFAAALVPNCGSCSRQSDTGRECLLSVKSIVRDSAEVWIQQTSNDVPVGEERPQIRAVS
jgi:DNA replicative helicase MCM subunit Mcm2 (Cdc46/Mcm family)